MDSGKICPRCGTDTLRGEECGECITRSRLFAATVVAMRYESPLDMLVKNFKYSGGWQLANLLSGLARERLDLEGLGDAVVAVPLHPRRERERGFNQSREIARGLCGKRRGGKLSGAAGPPLMEGWVSRVIDTPHQARMDDPEKRRQNVRGAFTASPQVRGRRIVVVDDVMTTGATLEEIAKILKRAGAASVTNAVLARTRMDV